MTESPTTAADVYIDIGGSVGVTPSINVDLGCVVGDAAFAIRTASAVGP